MKELSMIRTVCLIDDDPILQFLFKEIISTLDSVKENLIFSNGREAIDFFLIEKHSPENIPDLVVLDLNMPVMDGWDFLDEFIQNKPKFSKIPVIYIMSSSTHPTDKEKATRYEEISGYLAKPISVDKLTQMLEDSFGERPS